jgi:hypothetical protein
MCSGSVTSCRWQCVHFNASCNNLALIGVRVTDLFNPSQCRHGQTILTTRFSETLFLKLYGSADPLQFIDNFACLSSKVLDLSFETPCDGKQFLIYCQLITRKSHSSKIFY